MRLAVALALGLAAATAALVVGLTSDEPALVTTGPRLTASLLREWKDGDGPQREAAFSRNGAWLATSNAGGNITVRRVADWRPVRSFTVSGGATSVAFSPSAESLFTGGYDGIVRQWTVGDGSERRYFDGAEGTIWSIDVSPDGAKLAAAGEDATIRIWPLTATAGPARSVHAHDRNIWQVQFSPDGTRLASGSFDMRARLWDAKRLAPLATMAGHTQAVVALDYSPDGNVIATGGDDSTLRLWSASDGRPLRTIAAPNHVYNVDFSGDGRWLVTAGRARGGIGTFWHQLTGLGGNAAPVRIWRVADGAAVAALPHPDDVAYATFSPDGRFLVTSGEDQVRLWQLEVER